jgi:hypothetical protein
MADEKTPTPPAAEQGKEGGKKKIAGKWDTVEQAVEEGIGGLEKGFHSMSENVSKLTKLVEATLTQPIGREGVRSDPYQREGRQIVDDEVDPAKFIMNPGEFLRKRDEKLATTIVNQVVDLLGNVTAVNDFKSSNPHLVKHERVVQAFMKDQDPRLPIRDRLNAAGKAAEAYLTSLKVDLNAGNPNPSPQGGDYVEAPSGGTPPRKPIPADDDAEGEKALTDYINERNRTMADHFGVVEPKKE